MKYILGIIALMFNISMLFSQIESKGDILISSTTNVENDDLRDILMFEGIEFMKISFIDHDLAGKTYHLTVKEIWDGELKKESTIFNSKEFPYEHIQKVNDTVFNFSVISKLTSDSILKMTFRFPAISISYNFDAVKNGSYSLRNVANDFENDLVYGRRFYLLAYILPYENEGINSYCMVQNSGKDIEKWGKEFGIKHYLVFEMKFEEIRNSKFIAPKN